MKQIIVEKNIPVNNNELADKNRKLLDEKQIFTINLLGSPGSGKTCLLEKLIENIKTNYLNELMIRKPLKMIKHNKLEFLREYMTMDET